MSKQYSAKDVQEHNTVEKGLHIIIDGGVYEMGGTSGTQPVSRHLFTRGHAACGPPRLIYPLRFSRRISQAESRALIRPRFALT